MKENILILSSWVHPSANLNAIKIHVRYGFFFECSVCSTKYRVLRSQRIIHRSVQQRLNLGKR